MTGISVNCETPTHVWFFCKMSTMHWMTLREQSSLKHFIVTRRHIPYFYLPILGTQKSKSPLTMVISCWWWERYWLDKTGSRLLMPHLLFFIWSWAASDSIRIPNSEAGLFSVTAGTVNFVCQLGQSLGQVLIYMLRWRSLCRSDCMLPSKTCVGLI